MKFLDKDNLGGLWRFQGDLPKSHSVHRPSNRSRRGFLKHLGLGGLGLGCFLYYGCTRNERTLSAATDRSTGNASNERIDPISFPTQEFSFSTVSVDEKGEVIASFEGRVDYFEADLGNGVTLDMVMIPGGIFTMGSPRVEANSDDNEWPQHQVSVPAFAMGRYAVTQAQWQAIVGNNPSQFKGDRRPVEHVSWYDAVEFCKKLSSRTGQKYRLPSEAEWEYACRAGTTTPFHFGATITPELVNYNGNSPYAKAAKGEYRAETIDVGSFPPNAYGLYDMHGNLYEWCLDHWHDSYNGAPTDASAWVTGGDSERRIVRGGSWFVSASFGRSACRSWIPTEFGRSGIGFRVVLPVARV